MSLFDEGTVIIVGAGASVPFGLPTGVELIDLIVKAFRDEAAKIENELEKCQRLDLFQNVAPMTFAMFVHNDRHPGIEPRIALRKVTDLANWLDQQTGDSIDDIIRHNPNKAMALKVGICQVLFQRSYTQFHQPEKRGYFLKPINNRLVLPYARQDTAEQPKLLRNWIHHLINLARGEILNRANEGKKIHIISFNYDGILEHVLETKWNDVESELGHWSNYFDIVHPHGKMAMPYKLEVPLSKYLFENAMCIAVVHDELVGDGSENRNEIESNGIQDHRKRALEFCKDAMTVYAIGFAFARANVGLIGLNYGKEADHDEENEDPFEYGAPIRKYYYINFDDSFGLRARVKEVCDVASEPVPDITCYKVKPIEMTAGPGRTLQISDALIAGFLGEMPS